MGQGVIKVTSIIGKVSWNEIRNGDCRNDCKIYDPLKEELSWN